MEIWDLKRLWTLMAWFWGLATISAFHFVMRETHAATSYKNTSLRDPFGRDSFCTLAGDVNFDGAVTFSDFLVVSQNFGKTDAVWPEGDFDWDRNVGFSDYLMLADNFGSSFVSDPLDVSNVPEPSGAGHCGWILSVCLFVRRRRAIGKKCAL